jgi:NTE family protein
MLCRQLSPYDLNPLNYNPLRDLPIELIDFEGLRKQNAFEVMICVTNVRTARRRVFQSADLSVDAVLASATLPQMMTAVEIDGESYWDGGTRLPRLLPLFVVCSLSRHPPVFTAPFWMKVQTLGLFLRLFKKTLSAQEVLAN